MISTIMNVEISSIWLYDTQEETRCQRKACRQSPWSPKIKKTDFTLEYQQILRQLLLQCLRQEQAQEAGQNAHHPQDNHGQIVLYPAGEGQEGTQDGGHVAHDVDERHTLTPHYRRQQLRRELQPDVGRDVDEESTDQGERSEGDAERHAGGDEAEEAREGHGDEEAPPPAADVENAGDQNLRRELRAGGDGERREEVHAQAVQAPDVAVVRHRNHAPGYYQQKSRSSKSQKTRLFLLPFILFFSPAASLCRARRVGGLPQSFGLEESGDTVVLRRQGLGGFHTVVQEVLVDISRHVRAIDFLDLRHDLHRLLDLALADEPPC